MNGKGRFSSATNFIIARDISLAGGMLRGEMDDGLGVALQWRHRGGSGVCAFSGVGMRAKMKFLMSLFFLVIESARAMDIQLNFGAASIATAACCAHGGAGLGAAWGPRRAERHCAEAGFSQFERLEVDNSFNAFYRVSG